MTKENKLALVLGFGLVLLVGILIADHFSVASSMQPDPLLGGIQDPEVQRHDQDPKLITFAVPERDVSVSSHAGSPGLGQAQPAMAPSRTITLDPMAEDNGIRRLDTRRPPAEDAANHTPTLRPTPQQTQNLPYTIHTVTKGDTFTSICRMHYGDDSLLQDLARFNDIDDPNTIRIGQAIRIPAASTLVRGTTVADLPQTNQTPTPPAAPKTRPYTIQENDSLSVIAQRELGTAKRYLEIYELNRDLLDSPDDVVVGQTIKLPVD
jgi:nucleoid-associated protein YgaU